MSPVDPEVPPVGEELHIPGPSILPLLLAVGLTVTPILVVIGVVLSIIVIVRWVKDTRRDIDELPLDHH